MATDEKHARTFSERMLSLRQRQHDLAEWCRAMPADAANEIEQLRSVLDATHKLISEGALVGFNPHNGTWAERLFANQGQIHEALRDR